MLWVHFLKAKRHVLVVESGIPSELICSLAFRSLQVSLLAPLDKYERSKVADCLVDKKYNDGEYIIRQGNVILCCLSRLHLLV